jgi:hypothetical protein
LLSILSFLILNCIFFHTKADAQSFRSSYDLADSVGASESLDKFIQVVERTSSTNMEDFLVEWKKADPIIFRFYLLSFRSRSLQVATPQSPRVILFSPVADFMASFNSHSATRGSQNIELIHFDDKTERFEFRELTFDLNKRPQLSEVNPRKCLECHQSFSRLDNDPRPNWEPYFMWPGFFGMRDGPLLKSPKNFTDAEKSRLDPTLDEIILDEASHEDEWYNYFWKNIVPQDLRYSILDPYDNEISKKDEKLYGTHARREIKTSMFTQRIAQLNFRRVARLMTEDREVFNFLKEAIVTINHCRATSLPEEFLNWLQKNSTIDETANFANLNIGDKIKFLFEPFYYDTDDWSMDFKTNGRFSFSSRFGTPGLPESEMAKAFAKKSPEYSALKNMNCNSEFIESLKKYQDLEKASTLQKKRLRFKNRIDAIKKTPLINRCIHCHASPSSFDIPKISFDNLTDLQTQLQQTGYKRGRLYDEILYRVGVHADSDEQMPPQSITTPQQRNDFILQLEELM